MQAGSMKWRFTDIRNHFKEINESFDKTFDHICDLVCKTIVALVDRVEDTVNVDAKHRNNSFELFGFDILLDETLKPWLIEVPPTHKGQRWTIYESRLHH